jgi:membrane protease YdiL (CAAX protease family)
VRAPPNPRRPPTDPSIRADPTRFLRPLISGSDLAQLVELGLSLLVFSFILVAANLAERPVAPGEPPGEAGRVWRVVAYAGQVGVCTIVAALALLNIFTALVEPALTQGATGLSPTRVIEGNLLQGLGALVAPAFLLTVVRALVARVLRQFRPESAINAVGASMYVLVVTLFLSLQISTDQLRQIKASGQSPSLLYIIGTNQLPFLVIAVVGVGLFARRTPAQALLRLGLHWPGWRWLAGSMVVAVVLVIFGVAFDQVMVRVTPEQSRSINEASQQLLSNVTTPLAAIVLALAAGIGEEVLFRGALMPRLGNAAAALLFAVLHTQYAVSLASLEIFILGLALGWLRRRAGTTGAIVAHTGYDVILLLIPFVYAHH